MNTILRFRTTFFLVLVLLAGQTATSAWAQLTPVLSTGGFQSLFSGENVRVGTASIDTLIITNIGNDTLRIDTSSNITGNFPAQYTITQLPTGGIAPGASSIVLVRFNPTTGGVFNDTLHLRSNGGSATLPLLGTALSPQLTLSPTTITFDSTIVGQQSCQNILLTNPGSDTLAITNSQLLRNGVNFTYRGLTGTDSLLLPGQSRNVTLCFTPTVGGVQSGSLAFFSNIPTDTNIFVVNFSGYAVAPTLLTVNPVNVNNAVVNATTCLLDTVTNNGTTIGQISNVRVTGPDSTAFLLSTDSLPITLLPGQSTVLNLCVTPTRAGAQNAALGVTFTSAGLTQTQALPLNVFAGQGCVNTTTTSLFNAITNVGSTQTQTVTVTNCGNIPSNYTATLAGDSASYTIVGPTTINNIQPGATATFTVAFTPTAVDTNAARLVIGAGPGITPINVNLNGIGGGVTVQATDTIPQVAVGDCKDFQVRITNTGNVAWTPGTAMITGVDSTAFHIGALNPTTIAPGQSGTLTITFCPGTVGSRTAVLTFPNGSPSPMTAFRFALNGVGLVTSGVADAAASALQLAQSYPNPANVSASFTYALPKDETVQIVLVDAHGGVVRSIESGMRSSGSHDVRIDTRTLASGSYMLVLRTESGTMTEQIVVMH